MVTKYGTVPIVPAACIYDLGVKSATTPVAMDGYLACEIATANNFQNGIIGAGTGASVGKLFPEAKPMTGGLGYAELLGPNELVIRAYAVVNPVGDVINQSGQIIAGAISADGSFFDTRAKLLYGQSGNLEIQNLRQNTSLLAIFTNAALNKSQLSRLARSENL